jgi:hypothetical protein
VYESRHFGGRTSTVPFCDARMKASASYRARAAEGAPFSRQRPGRQARPRAILMGLPIVVHGTRGFPALSCSRGLALIPPGELRRTDNSGAVLLRRVLMCRVLGPAARCAAGRFPYRPRLVTGSLSRQSPLNATATIVESGLPGIDKPGTAGQ